MFAPVKMDLVGNIKVNTLACLCGDLSIKEWLSFLLCLTRVNQKGKKSFTLGTLSRGVAGVALISDRDKPWVGWISGRHSGQQ